MREVLSIGVGNVGCCYLSEYFNRLNDYLPLETYNRNVLFAHGPQHGEQHKYQPRVVFIDNADGFTRQLDKGIEQMDLDTIRPKAHPPTTISNLKPWNNDYLFCNQLKDYNCLQLDAPPKQVEMVNNVETPIAEHQQIINNMLFCDQLTNRVTYTEKIDECLRQNVEKCDSLSGFQLVTDVSSPYYMLKCDLMDRLNDDYSSKVVLDFSMENDNLSKISKGFQSIAKMLTINHFYQDKANCFIPFNVKSSTLEEGGFFDSIHRLNSLWTLNQQHSLNQFVYDTTHVPFGGASVGGLVGCAVDSKAHQFDSLVGLLDSWSSLQCGLDLQTTHHLLPHTNDLYTQYVCVGECALGEFRDFSPKLSKCKWRDAINLHIPSSCISTRDLLDAFLRYNYYGVKSYSFAFERVCEKSKNSVVSFFNGKQSYNYIHDMYVNSEKCLNAFIRRIATTDQYTTNYNKDNIDDILSHFSKVLTSYDSNRAFEDFDDHLDFDN